MTAIKFFGFTYFLGLTIFALVILAVVLAALGVETVGRKIDLAYPIIGAFLLTAASKYIVAWRLRKDAKHG